MKHIKLTFVLLVIISVVLATGYSVNAISILESERFVTEKRTMLTEYLNVE